MSLAPQTRIPVEPSPVQTLLPVPLLIMNLDLRVVNPKENVAVMKHLNQPFPRGIAPNA